MMIKVRTLLRHKGGSSTTSVNRTNGGFAGTASDTAREADHAARADWAARADYAEQAGNAGHAGEADRATDAELWDGHRWENWINQAVRTIDDVTFKTIVTTLLRSARFVDGVAGEGFGVGVDAGGEAFATVDRLIVRRAMTVMELLIERIRAVGGQICVSEANGKVKEVVDSGDTYTLIFEQETHGFMSGDLLRVAERNGSNVRGYWAEVQSVSGDRLTLRKSDCGSAPQEGDECVLMGNTADTSRQNLILISATHDGQPRVDVYNGVHITNLAGCLRARLGNLDGISDSAFPADNQPHGDGLYSDNAYLRGTFLLSTGEDVKTRFEIVEGRIQSVIEAVRSELLPDGYLSNQDFTDGETSWLLPTSAKLLRTSGGKWIRSLRRWLAKNGTRVAYVDSDGLHIDDCTIYQRGDDMRSKPSENTKVTLAVTIKPLSEGTLTAVIGEVAISRKLQVTGTTTRISATGLWDGTGDFSLTYTGKALISSVVVTEDAAAALAWRYRTFFEQSDKLIAIGAQNFDAEGHVIVGSSIEATAQDIALGVRTEIDGALRKTGINISDGTIEASADRFTFTDTDGHTQALIEDGKINADAVDVSKVIVRDTATPQKRVEITPDGGDIKIYDGQGSQCQQLTGNTFDDIAGFFGEGGLSLTIERPTGSLTTSNTLNRALDTVISTVWQAKAGELQMLTGEITAVAYCPDIDREFADNEIVPIYLNGASMTAALILQCFSDSSLEARLSEQTVASVTATQRASQGVTVTPLSASHRFIGGTATNTKSLAGVSIRATRAGYYRLILRRSPTISQSGASATATWGQNEQISARFNGEAYASTYFANGFALGTKTDNYVAAWNGADGMNLEGRNGDFGVRLNGSGLTALFGSVWLPIPRLMAHFSVTASSSGTYSVTLKQAPTTTAPTIARASAGVVSIGIPQAWRTALGSNFIAARMSVSLQPTTSRCTAALTSVSVNSLSVHLHNNGSAADCSFEVTILLI